MPELAPPAAGAGSGAQPDLSVVHEAYERGVVDGRAQATDELASDLEAAVHTLVGIGNELRAVREHLRASMEEHALALALAVARQVIRQEVTADPSLVADMVRHALDEVSWDRPVEVRVNPADLGAIKDVFQRLDDQRKPSVLDWVADDTIERGGYVIDTNHRLIDGNLDTVLKRMHEHLANA